MTRLAQLMTVLEARGDEPSDFTVRQAALYFNMTRSEAKRFLTAWRILRD